MIERRMFLAGSAAAAAGLGPGGALAQPAAATSTNAGVFRHGVASGDPLPDAVVLWTRVTPTADSLPGSGAGPRSPSRWQVATDRGFRQRRRARATFAPAPSRDHTVKVDVTGLAPATGLLLPVPPRRQTAAGRPHPHGAGAHAPRPTGSASASSRAPTPGRLVQRLPPPRRPRRPRRGAAPRRLPLRVRPRRVRLRPVRRRTSARTSPPTRSLGLADYRQRHAQYKTDPDLQAPAREVPVDRHLGRPRGRQRRLDRRRGEPQRQSEGDWATRKAAPVPGLRRVDAGAAVRHRGPRRRHPDLPPPAVRPARRAEHARPAQLPRPAGRRTGRPRLGRATRTRTITGRRAAATGSRTRLAADDAVEAGRQPGDDRAGHLRRRSPQDVARADQRHDRAAAPRRRALQRRPVGRLHRRPPRGRSTTSATTVSRTRSSSPATSTRAGRASCRPTPATYPRQRLGRRRVRRHLGDLQQPQGHHRHAAADHELAVEDDDQGQQPRTSSTSTSTTTASRSSTSPRSERRWTGSSSATAPTRRTDITWSTSWRDGRRQHQVVTAATGEA